MKNSLTILGAAVIIAAGLFFGLRYSAPPPPPPNAANLDVCAVCGKDRVAAHGRILVKNTTRRHVTAYVRHHPDAQPTVIKLDPNAFEVVPDVLVGTLMIRFVGDGFDEESHCTISPNTQHEMWWTTRGPEMRGAPASHM